MNNIQNSPGVQRGLLIPLFLGGGGSLDFFGLGHPKGAAKSKQWRPQILLP